MSVKKIAAKYYDGSKIPLKHASYNMVQYSFYLEDLDAGHELPHMEISEEALKGKRKGRKAKALE